MHTSRNAIYHDIITFETKITRHYVVDDAHYTITTNWPPHAKDMLTNDQNHTSKHPLSYSPSTTHHASVEIVIHRWSTIIKSNLCLTNNHDIPSIMINLLIKGHHTTLGLEASTNDTNRLIICNMKVGTPSYIIPMWRTTARGATIKRLNGTDLVDENHLKTLIEKYPKMKL